MTSGSSTAATEIPYEAAADPLKQKRLIDHVRTLYRSNDLKSLLPQGAVQSLALPGESYKLVFTPGLLTQVYRRTAANGHPRSCCRTLRICWPARAEIRADMWTWTRMVTGGCHLARCSTTRGERADPASTAGAELIEAARAFLPAAPVRRSF